MLNLFSTLSPIFTVSRAAAQPVQRRPGPSKVLEVLVSLRSPHTRGEFLHLCHILWTSGQGLAAPEVGWLTEQNGCCTESLSGARELQARCESCSCSLTRRCASLIRLIFLLIYAEYTVGTALIRTNGCEIH